MDQLPFELGEYRVLEKINEGRWSTIYKAQERSTQRWVAVKVLRDEAFGQEQYLTTLSTAPRHPKLLQIIEHGTTPEGRRYVVSELLLEGRTLEEEVRQNGALTPERALGIIGDLTDVFAALNQPYQTLKPGHVFLQRDPGRATLLLGIGEASLRTHDDEAEATMIRDRISLRELAFCSPGRLKGSWGITNDLYSLGALWYYMLTGDLPYPAGSEYEMELLIAQKEFPDVQQQCVVPNAHAQIIGRLTHHQRSEQYQSFLELKHALLQLQPNRSSNARSTFLSETKADLTKLSNRVRGRILEMQLREHDPLRLPDYSWRTRLFGAHAERFWYLHPTYLIGRAQDDIRAFSWAYLEQVGLRDDIVSLSFADEPPATIQRTNTIASSAVRLRYNGSAQELFDAVTLFADRSRALHQQQQAHTAPEAELFSELLQWRET